MRPSTRPTLGRVVETLVRPLRAASLVVQDTALAAVLTIAMVADFARLDVPPGGPILEPDPIGFVLVALLVAPLAVRRRWPRVVFTGILADAIIVDALLYRPSSLGFGLIVASYTVARWCPPRIAVRALLMSECFAVVVKLRVIHAGLDVDWFDWPLDAAYFGAAWFLGYSLRQSAAYAAELERSREALAARAVDDERARIARELHDSVGHAITAMVIHAGVAEQMLPGRPDEARRATETVGDVGRAALGEMDRVLGMLRDPADAGYLRPSLANVDHLIAEFEACGLDIDVVIEQGPSPLPTDVEQSAFRIVQEALTNTLKHAGATHVDVRIDGSGRGLDIRIQDAGPRSTKRPVPFVDHAGHGLVGMRERVAQHRGTVDASPSESGFLVTAHLPIGRST